LNRWIEETGDQGEIPEDPRIAAEQFLKRHLPGHGRVMKQRGLSPDITPVEYLEYWKKELAPIGR